MAADSVFRISRPLTVDVVITSTWNALISTSVLVLRSWKLQDLTNDVGDVPTQPNFFDFHTCSIIFLVNLFYCGAFCKLRLVTREWLILTKFGWCLPVFFHCASVLLGAPVLKDSVKTMSFALLITGLVLPSVVTTKAAAIDRFSSLEWVQLLPVWTLTGAWLGAAVIPLDWDRPWQVWPEPSCIGAAAATAMHSLYDIIRISISWVGRSPHMRKQRQT